MHGALHWNDNEGMKQVALWFRIEEEQSYYLPHLCVLEGKNTTTKLRERQKQHIWSCTLGTRSWSGQSVKSSTVRLVNGWNSHTLGTDSNYSKALWSFSMREAEWALEAQSLSSSQGVLPSQTTDITNQQTKSTNSQPQSGLWKDSASGSTKYGKCQQEKLITAPAEIVTVVAKFISSTIVPATARWIMTTGLQLSRRRNSASTVFARITRQRIVRANLLVESAMVSITQLFTEQKSSKSLNPVSKEASEADQASYALACLSQQSQVILATIVLPIKTPTGREIVSCILGLGLASHFNYWILCPAIRSI